MPGIDLAQFGSLCSQNPPGNQVSPVIASAPTIVVTHPVMKISGAVGITNITPPNPQFVGWVTLITLGAPAFATGGNIAAALAGVANVPVWAFYDGAMWYLK